MYSDITSFEDFTIEKERLILKCKMIDARIKLNLLTFRNVFSLSNIVFSLAKEFMLPKISDFLENLSKRMEK